VVDAEIRVAALLLNWRQVEATLRCLADLIACGHRGLEVLVMDNGSGDGSAERLRVEASAEVLAFDENLGYCEAMNRGIAWAAERGVEQVLLVNNDMRLPQGFLTPMCGVLRNDRGVVAVGPTVLSPDGRVWAQGGEVGFFPNVVRLRGHGAPPARRGRGPEAVDFVPGACGLFRLADLQAVGGLDEDYFMYWEDVDLCRRLRAGGRAVIWLPWVSVTHDASRSSGGGRSPLRKYMQAANAVRYLRSHGTLGQWLGFLVLDGIAWPLALFGRTGPRAALAKARGMLAGVFGHRVSARDVQRYVP
jgi:GT2 family glycosyltransferase